MSSIYSVGQMNELGDAFERNGWTPADVKRLSGGDILARLLPLVSMYGGHIVDCDQKPYEPNGLTVLPESEQLPGRVRGQFVLAPASIRLHLSPNQQNGKRIKGTELAKELANMPVLPANVLDAYLAHPELIPEELKGKVTYFWGTKYRDADGSLCVRYLCFHGGRWRSRCSWLERVWRGLEPAAVRAS